MASTLAASMRADRISGLSLRDVCAVETSTSVEEVIGRMSAARTGCALVRHGGKLVGIFTERDFLSRVVAAHVDVKTTVQHVMTYAPKTLSRSASVYEAVQLMEAGGYRHVPVLGEDGSVIGVLSVKDIVHYLVGYFPANVYNLPPPR